MTQYCRYCSNMVCGDANYCSVRDKCYTDKQICRTNDCKDFKFNSIDALGINTKGYQPRKPKAKNKDQTHFYFYLGGDF